MPVVWAQATPATTTVPGSTTERVGMSIRDAILIGPRSDHPFCAQ